MPATKKSMATGAKKAPAKRAKPTQQQSSPLVAMSDQELMDDMLSSQKLITGIYNTYSSECVNQQLKADFLSHWKDNQNLQSSVFTQMQQRGWYAPKKAQAKMVTQAKTKFQGIQGQLPT